MKHNIYQQHQRRYLQLEYDNKCKQSTKLENELKISLQSIKNKLNPLEFKLLEQHLRSNYEKEKKQIKATHKKKIEQLSKGDAILDEIDPKKVVHNISSPLLTPDEESILSKGLQFCIEMQIKNSIEFQTDIEMMAFNILKQLDKPEATSLNACLTDCIRRSAN
ncbi:unnamed protein product [Didymodactylos carnosus]|uniref:Uncharacterized protein n=1 Tax=Didymodactylos carnosus TaxID=1234261 RepID=A0A815JBW7_9BILA|nr:unnamed protein product [Didymodactylos carnosus]CAF1380248.1 unnamed protein product [Didymodactylos carnosus]CAF4131610.1 unnamed protein product [Didymodactylos carnosus]CAF4274293.1 unnamed protein product [Didymodactylos carnosus]